MVHLVCVQAYSNILPIPLGSEVRGRKRTAPGTLLVKYSVEELETRRHSELSWVVSYPPPCSAKPYLSPNDPRRKRERRRVVWLDELRSLSPSGRSLTRTEIRYLQIRRTLYVATCPQTRHMGPQPLSTLPRYPVPCCHSRSRYSVWLSRDARNRCSTSAVVAAFCGAVASGLGPVFAALAKALSVSLAVESSTLLTWPYFAGHAARK